MTVAKRLEVYSLLLGFIGAIAASKCPEPRKPHLTSCTIFYNCVNLPGGGYVWAPARCTNGLVFQPYLRICVLPGDSWTCDILATEPPETTTREMPELIDSTLTSYLGYGEDDASKYGEPVDSYYKLDRYTEPSETHSTVTPYPLIEVTAPNSYINQIDSTIQNIGLPIAIKHSEDNYLYHFVNGQQVLSTPANANSEQLQTHLQHLSELLERLTANQGVGIPHDRQPPLYATTTTTTPRSAIDYAGDYNGNDFLSNGYSNEKQGSAILNFLLKNYLQKNEGQSNGVFSNLGTIAKLRTAEQTTQKANDEPHGVPTTTEPVDLEIKGHQSEDNIVVVSDSLNNKQYFTIGKYKSIAHQLLSETVELLPCTNGVRLPNSTDCTRYYSCEPSTAKIRQFSCPENTAFNQYKRLCETGEYALCKSEATKTVLRISHTTVAPKMNGDNGEASKENTENKSPCQTIGKHSDPTSEKHYYLCFSEKDRSNDMKFQRMVCPNSLIFCEDKNLCTTRKRCRQFQS
ncbi:uncharacterized protein LOC125501073 [Athalia rosae]|uniref:uncharacterized protein LOC125501073 n=1 Tax=Athalia rosae TaxID=37344 RepID=UPI002033ACAB|nr:uncharacterized protein LOC125501073 [Athalia rosae]